MFRQLNFRSFFNFLGRNKLYAAINIFGLSVSLMFVILIADYTLRQLTCDDYHAKADRIYVIGNEERITSGYYLQKYLRDRYPEIESTCAVVATETHHEKDSGTCSTEDQAVRILFIFCHCRYLLVFAGVCWPTTDKH